MKEIFFRFVAILYLFQSCASLTTPSGGPKDVDPPELIRSIPENNKTNFKGKSVELTFNELVKLNNPREEIIISPSPGKNIDMKVKGTRVSITPDKGWKDSTTYSILFRQGIQDVTEGNSPDSIGLKLAFSTGSVIDSLSVTGKVEDLLKGTIAPKTTVCLYKVNVPDTFNIFTDTSTYFTKTNKNGRFKIENIKVGKYRIYAFDDKNKNLKVESRAERYGFIAKEFLLEKNIDSLTLSLIMLDARPLKISSIRNGGTITRVRFNKYVTDYVIKADSDLTHAFGADQTEITIWNPNTSGDSLQLQLLANDSLKNNVDSVFYLKKADVKPVKEKFQWSPGDPIVDSETGNFTTIIKHNKPLTEINLDSLFIEVDDNLPAKDSVSKIIHLKPPKRNAAKSDTSKFRQRDTLICVPFKIYPKIPITKEDISLDLAHRTISIKMDVDKKLFKGVKDPKFTLKAGLALFYSIDRDTSKSLSKNVPILWPEDTGILFVEINTQEKNYIIQLLDKEGRVLQILKNETKHTFKNLLPGDYQLRVIIDANQNDQWDPGNILEDIEPERVIFYKTAEKKQFFIIRANWELGPLILKF